MSERTRATRHRERLLEDRAALNDLVDEVRVGHFGLADDHGPAVFPTAIVRDGDRVLAHGSTGSRWMRRLADGAPTCLAVTAVDGLVVARSGFASSMNYRSAVVFGSCAALTGEEKALGLEKVTDRLIPGRASEIRASRTAELAATTILALPLTEWSLKVRNAFSDDDAEDLATETWAGVLPIRIVYDDPVPHPDLRAGIAVPESVRALRQQ